MSINRDKLLFSFECNHNHNNLLKRSKTYINANQNYLKSNNSDINFLPEKPNLKMINKDNNTLNQTDNFDCKNLMIVKKITSLKMISHARSIILNINHIVMIVKKIFVKNAIKSILLIIN